MPSRNRGRLIASVLVAATLVVAGLTVVGGEEGAPAVECEPSKPGQIREAAPALIRTTDDRIVHTRIGGGDFFVPRNYFRHPQIGCGIEEPGMLLRVLLPDLRPYSEETAAEFAAQRGHGMLMNILLTFEPHVRPLGELVDTALNGGPIDPPSSSTFGLFSGRERYDDDLFFSRQDDGHVTRLIRCRPTAPDRSAGCRHRFRLDPYDVQITYGRQHLPNWRRAQQAVEQLLTSFTELPHR